MMMVDSALVEPAPQQPSSMDRLDAAHALLGASESNPFLAEPVEEQEEIVVNRRPRSGSVGLDELAELAAGMESQATNSVSLSSSSDEDSEAMPPPPPRRRPRASSNPEGMEKWCERRHFVLPSAILEEELAEASALAKAHQERFKSSIPIKNSLEGGEEFGTSPDSVATSPIMLSASKDNNDSYLDDEDMEPEDLLKRARSRLLEDLSEGTLKGEKGALALPHSLSKYKETYNKNGRIGIYTPAERAAIIARFHSKRSRRVWNKKIRYGCRKNLADRRLRVKGRFVKRTPPLSEDSITLDLAMPDVNDPEAGFVPTADQPYRRRRRHTIT
jgi:hypothetical protein